MIPHPFPDSTNFKGFNSVLEDFTTENIESHKNTRPGAKWFIDLTSALFVYIILDKSLIS